MVGSEPNVPVAAETTNGVNSKKLTFKLGTVTHAIRQNSDVESP
jgi:hypothetical protein